MKTLTNGKIAVSALSVRAAVVFLAALALPCRADPAPVIHYAPIENLEHVDVALIDRAEHEIDMAAYVLTDFPNDGKAPQAPAMTDRLWEVSDIVALIEAEEANVITKRGPYKETRGLNFKWTPLPTGG